MSRVALSFLVLAGPLVVSAHLGRLAVSSAAAQHASLADAQPERDDEATDPLGRNAACYLCHIPFVREELSRTHLQAEITCIKCHGPSTKHVNDEQIGATEPDITYKRDQVKASCRQCHESHDVEPERVVARWLERGLTELAPVCTDCHGMHRIQASEESEGTQDD